MSKYGITRDKALELLGQHVQNKNLVKHCLATEAVMKALAEKFGEDVEMWTLAGLLHDLDVEETRNNMQEHTIITEKLLKENGVSDVIIDAIKRHNELASHGLKREDKFHIALGAGETITGLVVASTLILPDKKIASLKSSSVVNRMKEKKFAASVNRDTIMECEKLGMKIEEFAELAVDAMRKIAGDLGL